MATDMCKDSAWLAAQWELDQDRCWVGLRVGCAVCRLILKQDRCWTQGGTQADTGPIKVVGWSLDGTCCLQADTGPGQVLSRTQGGTQADTGPGLVLGWS